MTWLDKAELVESKAVTMTNNLREQRRLFDFSMRFAYRAPETPADKKNGPASPAKAAAANGKA